MRGIHLTKRKFTSNLMPTSLSVLTEYHVCWLKGRSAANVGALLSVVSHVEGDSSLKGTHCLKLSG